MKSDKEYPATHSMSTSWFGIDRDGNVGIIDFEDNGPVPSMVGEESGESIVVGILPSEASPLMASLPFTDPQALHLIEALLPADPVNPVCCEYIVKMNPEATETFVRLYESNFRPDDEFTDRMVCLSQKFGLYILDFSDWAEEDVEVLYTEKIIERSLLLNLFWNDRWNDKLKKYEFSGDSLNLPFFFYCQPYNADDMIHRVSVPLFPLHESQIDPVAARIAVRFPFSFKEQAAFQIADFVPCQSRDFMQGTEPGPSMRLIYPSTDGSVIKVDEDTFFDALADEPRIFVLGSDGLHLSKTLPFLRGALLFSPFRASVPDDHYHRPPTDSELLDRFKVNRPRFERLLDIIRPYCLIVEPKARMALEQYYPVEKGSLVIGGKEYPLINLEQVEAHTDMIEKYLSMPYRGADLKRIVR